LPESGWLPHTSGDCESSEFERALSEYGDEAVTTGDVLDAIGQTRRTLTPELVAEFEQDIHDYARV
jgi:hypothetical protein